MGVASSVLTRKSTRDDEQACEAGGISKRRRDHFAPDDIQETLDGDGKRVRSGDSGAASDSIVCHSGVQLHCSDEETGSLLFSSKPRAAASGNILDPSGSEENVQLLRKFVSLSEIPAPFFGTDTTSSMVTPTSYDLQHFPPPHLSMDPAGLLSSLDVDSLGSGLGSPLPLPDHSVAACDVPFLYLEAVAPRLLGAGCMIC